ncbi:hypothetical protein SERLA73DRAFT_149578 [Serpula lacrymans var. lacrymans S7.3]|uniref:HAT C-terminal dimerisation domain-containing protein n=1 Tax=Serpula lacrymans var. lacrymans (strain S7.3) TaxID=936435 RepID=F8PJ11_SERL3|nr:hypothetical protein SERLA73DRAFT_149578 [Serpula lacrymans var. lacrymans S7.3]
MTRKGLQDREVVNGLALASDRTAVDASGIQSRGGCSGLGDMGSQESHAHPEFSIRAFYEHLVNFIVADDQLHELIIEAWQNCFMLLKDDMTHAVGQIFSHYIVREEATQGLHSKAALIAFHCLKGNHSGKALARTIRHLLDRAGITVNRMYNHKRYLGQRKDEFRNLILAGDKRNWFKETPTRKAEKLPAVELLWDVRTRLRELKLDFEIILMVPHIAQQVMSGESMPLLGGCIPMLETVTTQWETLAENSPRLSIFTSIALKWANKYYQQVDNTSAYILAMLIMPTIQFSWISKHWENCYIRQAKSTILDTMREHKSSQLQASEPQELSQSTSSLAYMSLADTYGISDMQMGRKQGTAPTAHSVEEEYNVYALAPLSFWFVTFVQADGKVFPTLFAIAMDYLPI